MPGETHNGNPSLALSGTSESYEPESVFTMVPTILLLLLFVILFLVYRSLLLRLP